MLELYEGNMSKLKVLAHNSRPTTIPSPNFNNPSTSQFRISISKCVSIRTYECSNDLKIGFFRQIWFGSTRHILSICSDDQILHNSAAM